MVKRLVLCLMALFLCAAASDAYALTARETAEQEAQKILCQDQTFVPLVEASTFYAYSAKIEGTPRDRIGIDAGVSFNSFAVTRFTDPSMIN